jgi:glycosyltransferase involved in cell wall biosynthesis
MRSSELMLSIIIPVYNEESTIGNVIERVQTVARQTSLKHEIIVVDDYSVDKSLAIAGKYGVRLFRLKMHLGKGYGLRAGFLKAKGNLIITIDSDGSHKPEELPKVLAPILADKADLVIGSRYLNQKDVAARKLNAFGVKIFNFIIKMLTGVAVTDSQSGYRAMRQEVLANQHLKSGGYEIESEMLVKTAKQDFRVLEVPISFQQRTYGRSGVDPVMDGFRILLSIVMADLKR